MHRIRKLIQQQIRISRSILRSAPEIRHRAADSTASADSASAADSTASSESTASDSTAATDSTVSADSTTSTADNANTGWKCTQTLDTPSGYNGGAIRLELIQDVNGEPKASTIINGQNVSFPYQLDISGAEGVTSGTIYLYEQVNGDYQQLGTYTVTFKKAE